MCPFATVVIFWSEAFVVTQSLFWSVWFLRKWEILVLFTKKKRKRRELLDSYTVSFFSFTNFNRWIPNFNNFGIGLDILYQLVLLLNIFHLCSTELVCLFLKLVFCSCYPIGFGTRGFLCEDIDIKQASAIERPFLWNGIALWHRILYCLNFLESFCGLHELQCRCWLLFVSMLYGSYVLFWKFEILLFGFFWCPCSMVFMSCSFKFRFAL